MKVRPTKINPTETLSLTTTTTTRTSTVDFTHRMIRVKPDREIHVVETSNSQEKDDNDNDNNDDDDDDDDSEQTLVFFIHGVGGSVKIWNHQLKFFAARGYACAAMDLVGHGGSVVPRSARDFHFEEIKGDVFSVFDSIKRERNVVIAHSYGSAFASLLAHTFPPPTIHHIVLFAGGAPYPLRPDEAVLRMPSAAYLCCSPCIRVVFEKVAFHGRGTKVRRKSSLPPKQAFRVSPFVLKNIMCGQVWPGGNAAFHAAIRTPALVVHGESDKLVSLEDDDEMFRVLPLGEFLLVKGASHMAMMEKPEDVNEIILSFLTRDSDKREDRNAVNS